MLGEGEATTNTFPVSPRLDEEQYGGDAPDPSQEIIAVSAPSYRRNIALGEHGQGNDIAGIDGREAVLQPCSAIGDGQQADPVDRHHAASGSSGFGL